MTDAQPVSPAHARFVERVVTLVRSAVPPELLTQLAWKRFVLKQIAELELRGKASFAIRPIAEKYPHDALERMAVGVAAAWVQELQDDARTLASAGKFDERPGGAEHWNPAERSRRHEVETLDQASEISRAWGDDRLADHIEDLEHFAMMAAKWRGDIEAFLTGHHRGRRTDPSTIVAEACAHALPGHDRPAEVARILCAGFLAIETTQTQLRRRLGRRTLRSKQSP